MLLRLEHVVDDDAVIGINETVAAGEFVPGTATALGAAAQVKHNLQLPIGATAAERAGTALLDRLRANPFFELATQPVGVSPPLFSRYEAGMSYGDHMDAALMGPDKRLRADIAVTVFLCPPESYDGGELVIETDYGVERCKGAQGDCVVYPAHTIHRVEAVTAGVRLVAVLWIQSAIRDPAKRKLLFDISRVTRSLALSEDLAQPVAVLRRCEANLLRMWAET